MTSRSETPLRLNKPVKFGVILAVGQSRRMAAGGTKIDKALLDLGGKRLIDHVAERLEGQCEHLLIAGPVDFNTGLQVVPDRVDGPAGPAAALWAVAKWLGEHAPDVKYFITAPVDGPFLPLDLVERLSVGGQCAVAVTGSGLHPTFARWEIEPLLKVLSAAPDGEGVALQWLAERCHAASVQFTQSDLLININTRDDLARAQEMIGNK